MTARPATSVPSPRPTTRCPACSRSEVAAHGAREVRAELLRLHERPLGQVGAGDAGREAEVVLDPRARARLPAGRDHVDAQRSQPLGCAVDGGGEPGRAAADDDEVEAAVGQASDGQAEVLAEGAGRRPAQHRSRHDHHGQLGGGDADVAQQSVDGIVVVGVEPLVRDAKCGRGTPGCAATRARTATRRHGWRQRHR